MQWVKAFHVIFMVCWFAGLFYLPRLFVYHAMSKDEISHERFKIMERKLFFGIMTPAALLTILFGHFIITYNPEYYLHSGWLQLKLCLVTLLVIFHIYCGKLYYNFKNNKNPYSHTFYRWLNEVPTILLIAIVILVEVKPF